MRLTTDESYGLAIIAFRLPGNDNPLSRVPRPCGPLSSQRSTLFDLVPEGKALYTGFSLDTMPQAGLGYVLAAFSRGADPTAW